MNKDISDVEFDRLLDENFSNDRAIKAALSNKLYYEANPDQRRTGEKNPMFGKSHTKEVCKRLSENHKGLQAGEKNGMFGKSRPQELKDKLSNLYKGVKVGEKNPFFGKTHSEETKKIISQKRGTRATAELKPCYAIDPSGKRFDFNSISECGIQLNYPSFVNNAHMLLPEDGTTWKVQRGKFKGWSFARIV
jgi:hypothetical protein